MAITSIGDSFGGGGAGAGPQAAKAPMQIHTMHLCRNSSRMEGALGRDYSGEALWRGLPHRRRSPIMGGHMRSRCNDQRRAAPHCMVVNLVRSGRKQP
jgi:hypothetical protein